MGWKNQVISIFRFFPLYSFYINLINLSCKSVEMFVGTCRVIAYALNHI